VVLADLDIEGRLRHRPVASCILPLGAVDGCEVVTVEHLKALYGGALHPVQRALVEHHGSQCGFCTPGFVMALYAHMKLRRDGADSVGAVHRLGPAQERQALCDALAGNLCRCTGYAPILAAGADMHRHADAKREAAEDAARAQRLRELPTDTVEIEHAEARFCAPRSAAELARWLAKNPGARLLAGGTDLGLEITKQLRHFDCVAYVGRVAELRVLREEAEQLEIGAAITYAEAYAALARLHPDLGELLRRIGGAQVRAAGTIGGNVANGSPIGDTMPALLALDAQVLVDRQGQKCKVPLYSFYTGYRQSVLRAGEFILTVQIPKLNRGARFAAYKLSRRFDQDISGVCAAFCAEADGTARFGFGGMAATPARAPKAEAAWSSGVEAACAALAEDFRPLSDHRASGWYRLTAAQNLLRKFAAGVSPRTVLELSP
jgi:xanthine dehydrogenase small subunit